ncbi:ribosome biogenesis GTPase YlqF [Mycoplasma iguanae]|uniref:Ribosome biogenesis GTPase A n=1 Tax=Mycoplasma iguanae TaxID=292461 RepID=A0ABY5RB66_9MOLU|nr:ribosome biogenesis GTPase YlqF [Mycoplasma iguanae]UVD81855.1 ribosome biogenesis GTPase YlqF [Mycoplasma iguanae]
MSHFQWFPGHMAKALREIKEKQTLADLFIITLDARAPISSYNEEFDYIAPHKPRLFVITKIDLADKSKLPKIRQRFNSENAAVIEVNLKKFSSKEKIIKAAEKLLYEKRIRDLNKGLLKPRLRVFVMGVPNSGKSTLINLVAQAKTKVGNMPGVTKGQQWIKAGDLQLLDTPGILWPKASDELIGIKIAIIGSIKFDIIPPKILFNECYRLVSKYYPEKIIQIGLKPADDEVDIYNSLHKLCEIKKFYLPNQEHNLDKAMKWFTTYLRDLKGVTYD